MEKPVHGIYDALCDQSLRDILAQVPELRAVLGKIDTEEQPARYASFIASITISRISTSLPPATDARGGRSH